jgi:16S rRNA (cytosine967-C5)-methyltransferase
MKMHLRATAARLLQRLETRHVSLDGLLADARQDLPVRDQALLQELCFGACRWHDLLEALLSQLLHKPLRDRDRDIHWLLLLGLYQLRELRMPPHAAVSETVSAAGQLGKPWASKLVNGVLRNYQKRADSLEAALDADSRLSHPTWLSARIARDWPEQAQDLMAANNCRPPMTLRVNRRQSSREDALALLASKGFESSPCRFSDDGIRLAEPCDPYSLPGFAAGLFSVQDEAAQLAAALLEPRVGERILDACAAPGGKTCHLLELQPAVVELVAIDIDGSRLLKVEENLQRCELQAQVLTADIAAPDQWWDGRLFDAILADLPCSATGVVRRHPDIKVLRQEPQIAEVAATQARLLAALWQYLKPGGRLLYCTCSILDEENDAIVSDFLAATENARLLPLCVHWGHESRCGRQLLPGKDDCDGFFYSLLHKSEQTGNSAIPG